MISSRGCRSSAGSAARYAPTSDLRTPSHSQSSQHSVAPLCHLCRRVLTKQSCLLQVHLKLCQSVRHMLALKGQVIKVVVDALAGRVSFHSAASGQTVVMDGLPKGELWLAAGLQNNSATLVAFEHGGVQLDLN